MDHHQQNKETVVLEKRHSTERATTARKLVLIVIAFIAFLGIRNYLPVSNLPDGASPDAVRTGLAILTLAAILWLSEALPLAITALLIPVTAALTGTMPVSASFSGFSHPLIFLFLGGFGLAAALSRQELDRWLAMRILILGQGKFHLTAIALFLVSAMLSMWISNTATVALLLPVALGILSNIGNRCGNHIREKVAPYLLLGIAYSASVGGIGSIIGTPPNAIAAANLKISFTEWLAIGIPCVLVLLPTLFILLRMLARPGKVPDFEVQTDHFSFTPKRLLTLAVFFAAVACWLFSSPLSSAIGIDTSFDTLVALGAVLILASLRLVRWKDIDRATDWGVLLLFGGGITLSKVLGSTGASAFLAAQIQSLTTGWPIIFIVGVIVLFVIFLTELSSNTASTALLVPIFAAVAIDMGIPTTQLVLPLTVAASCAFMLPIATPPNAIVFASGHIQQRQMVRIGLVLNLSFAAIITLMGYLFFS
ncbi:DASS family sodium-coupled anion symporter [Verrucomicrobiaceae bacterium N1E253]|uniref:DASS family sodium-coupled anion symporter n=1 Tax=Oceaniferula marina TaxID=2748318 RepID=A0A851GGW8_9BACT|nr:DASS family sodium-coupled anion symporter [Oceaniferula marina]NWK56773.1 DASS family sodium-coupled anion symporter [Oceaniferula marina]